jgi:beta-aspartyl-peptidase (threonine type)
VPNIFNPGAISKSVPEEMRLPYFKAIQEALAIGTELLAKGGTSLDAAEAVVRYMEDCPLFNAGRGSVFTHSVGAAFES